MGIKEHVEQLTGLLSLPKQVVLNLPQIILTGKGEVSIENYKNLIEFTESLVRVNTNSGIAAIHGNRLNLKQITTESITVTGDIVKVEYNN